VCVCVCVCVHISDCIFLCLFLFVLHACRCMLFYFDELVFTEAALVQLLKNRCKGFNALYARNLMVDRG